MTRYTLTVTKILQQAIIVSYLVLLLLGAAYAAFRFQPIPFRPLTLFVYGMLAPYQGYNRMNEAFLVEGRIGEEWEEIDLAPYFPTLEGERNMRERRLYLNVGKHPSVEALHRRIAERIRELEAERGTHYESVRLTWIEWEPAPESFRANAATPTRTHHLVTIP